MDSFGERLKAARERKGMMQRDVAAVLECAPTSLTNWERDKVQPPLEMLARLCEVLEIHPLNLLDEQYTYSDIVRILKRPTYERSYQEMVALNFSGELLQKLMPNELQRIELERLTKLGEFLRNNNIMERFGQLGDNEVETLRNEYDMCGGADSDILFAYHMMNSSSKAAFLDMLFGLFTNDDNIQGFGFDLTKSLSYTASRISQQRRMLCRPDISVEQGGA